jgi:hypothetical protein
MLWIGVGAGMEQLRQFLNLRAALISETHAPLCACVGAIMCIKIPVQKVVYAYNMDIGDYGSTPSALMEV